MPDYPISEEALEAAAKAMLEQPRLPLAAPKAAALVAINLGGQ